MSSPYSSAFYTNFVVTNTAFTRNGDVSANVAWVVTCKSNGFQETFSTIYTIPSPGLTDQQVKDNAFNSISYQVLPWSNRALSQPPLTLGSTGTYTMGNLYVNGSTNRVGVGTSTPSDTFQVQGDCNIQGTSYKIGGASVLTATALGSSITSSSLTTLGTLASPMNLGSGQSYRINNADVLSATSLGSGVTTSSLTSVGTLSSLQTAGNVQFYKQGTNSTNFQYNATNNVMTFGAGSTGGNFQIIGTLVQGVTGTTGQAGNAKFGYRNPGQFVELGADSPNTAYIDFHSNVSTDVDYDTRILSVGGTAPDSGGGAMGLFAQNFVFHTILNRSNPMIETYLNTSYKPGNLLATTMIPRTNVVDEYIFSGEIAPNTTTSTWGYPAIAKGGGVYVSYQMHITCSNLAGNWNSFMGNVFINSIGNAVIYQPTTTAGSSPIITLGSSGPLPRLSFNNNTSSTAYWTVRMLAMTNDQ